MLAGCCRHNRKLGQGCFQCEFEEKQRKQDEEYRIQYFKDTILDCLRTDEDFRQKVKDILSYELDCLALEMLENN